MNQKLIIIAVLSFLILGFVGYFIFGNIINKSYKTNSGSSNATNGKLISVEANFDFGDAPDGKRGQFPSLLASNGSRVKKTDDVWLGQAITVETDSKQVNADEADDGVKLNM